MSSIDALDPPDENTLRILVSTDNHLGYLERDPIRGLDSFAALEEVLYLAKKYKSDMVLLAGDLFHENKPTRRTMHKTMEIIKRYTMGPNPVKIQILSEKNFAHGEANYLQEFYSVDLPIFSIHGNHDDPTRDGNELLAALDLLSVSHLVNYFGRQDMIDKVEIAPILLKKGDTQVALYGMGSLRDERLNRMWQAKKVRFQRPSEGEWFNIFALHQNRDLGRGSKNCVHESMIPEWMDLIVWGHEHECLIQPSESVVGTFRITQPGSSVATSLTAGESVRKHVGVLDIRNNQFRLTPVPLVQVRSFIIGEVSLNGQGLDPEDPKVDDHVTSFLENEVKVLIHQAKEKRHDLLIEAKAQGNDHEEQSDTTKNIIQQPEEILIRLKVEHSGFTTLNNQRFGARFVGRVANLSDILLFHRKKEANDRTSTKKKRVNNAMDKPIAPEDHDEMNIEDLVAENLDNSDKKMEMLDESKLNIALEDFVSKEIRQALSDATKSMLSKHQKKLFSRQANENDENEEMDQESGADEGHGQEEYRGESPKEKQRVSSRTEMSSVKTKSIRSKRKAAEAEEETASARSSKARSRPKRRNQTAVESYGDHSDDDDELVDLSDDEEEEEEEEKKSVKRYNSKRSKTSTRTSARSKQRRKYTYSDNEEEDEMVEILDDVKEKYQRKHTKRPPRRAADSSRSTKRTVRGDDNDENFGNSYGIDDDWGESSTLFEANTNSDH